MTVGYGFDIETQLGHSAIAHLGLNYNEVCALAISAGSSPCLALVTLTLLFFSVVYGFFHVSNCRFSLATHASTPPPSTSCCRCSFRLQLSRQPQLVSTPCRLCAALPPFHHHEYIHVWLPLACDCVCAPRSSAPSLRYLHMLCQWAHTTPLCAAPSQTRWLTSRTTRPASHRNTHSGTSRA